MPVAAICNVLTRPSLPRRIWPQWSRGFARGGADGAARYRREPQWQTGHDRFKGGRVSFRGDRVDGDRSR